MSTDLKPIRMDIEILDGQVPQDICNKFNLELLPLSKQERDLVLVEIVEKLMEPLPVSGPTRNEHWEDCWSNLITTTLFNKDVHIENLYPPYFKEGNKIFRATKQGENDGDWYKVTNPYFEPHFLHVLKHYILEWFDDTIDTVCEIGCGSCWNALDFFSIKPNLNYLALDWASSVSKIVDIINWPSVKNLEFHQFDMFRPDRTFNLSPSTCLFTSTAMEQLGLNFEPFLRWMLEQPCKLYVHIEPLYELYGDSPFYRFGKAYHNKRGYLRGFLPTLQKLERERKIDILLTWKTLGCRYNDNLDLLIWKKTHV